MSTSASTHPSPLRRLLPVASALALVLIAVGAFANVRMAPGTLTQPEAPVISAPVRLSLPDASARVAMPRELVEMEAAGLVTLARPLPAAPPRLAWQGGTGYHVWGDCTDPFVRQAAPELCM